MIKAILFDKDGTLIEFERTWHQIMSLLFEQLPGEDVTKLQALSGYLATGFASESIIQYMATDQIVEHWLPLIKHHSKSQLVDLFTSCALDSRVDVVALPSAVSTVKRLSRDNYLMGVVTADGLAATEHHLNALGILSAFSYVGSNDCPLAAKPDPAMALDFMARFSLKPHQVLMVGDSISDMQFAANAGMAFVGIRSNHGKLKQLDNCLLIDQLDEIFEQLVD